MKIFLYCPFGYYQHSQESSGYTPCTLPSGGGTTVNHLLAQGLSNLGHEVYYYLKQGADGPLPPKMSKIILADEIITDADVMHNYKQNGTPYIYTKHSNKDPLDVPVENNVFVSKFLANFFQSDRFIYNGIDPEGYVYSNEKEDYFIYMSAMGMFNGQRRYYDKGLDIALKLRKKVGFRLVVAGGATTRDIIEEVGELCKEYGADYIGDIRGKDKANWLAKAKGFIFPTRLPEAFGLVAAEALMSGTPVISSSNGACAEVIPPEVGFVCSTESDYLQAFENIDTIDPQACRNKAMTDYHYLKMADSYVQEYQKEILKKQTLSAI